MKFIGDVLMKPERSSFQLLGVTRSKAKMYEYQVPEDYHIQIIKDPSRLFNLSIGILGSLSAMINSENIEGERFSQVQESLKFSARFFDSYLQARLNEELDPYLLLLGSAAYYLCDLPGSSYVLIQQLGLKCPYIEAGGLESLLFWLLQGNVENEIDEELGPYIDSITRVKNSMIDYVYYGKEEDSLIKNTIDIRKEAYDYGTPRELLFSDIIGAVIKKRISNSVWSCLPRYSGIDIEFWRVTINKSTFIKEFWPAQHLLGKAGIFRGESGVVQMPTSAGKTKATEIIIRSAILSGRTSLAIVVAPFRALCNEISNSLKESYNNETVNIDELSDVMQTDFEIQKYLERKQILIVTPEKLLYVLRQAPELALGIGLLIYDEGHQFDNGSRGITYELLLTSLKSMISEEIQTVLISAVIKNAEAVGNWLNGEGHAVVSGTNLTPTYRTVAFTSWLDQMGRLEFVQQNNPDRREFFVPRIIEQHQLQLRNRERKERVFPEKADSQSIALYLGIKLISNGSIAIFSGTKAYIASMCEKVVEAYDRELGLTKPINYSDQEEIQKLYFLYEQNLGGEAIYTQSASLGILTHHGSTPHGIRLSVEYAMQRGMAKFVICTSTLAQGVNLPIRYLILANLYQGSKRIKTRDFHNLIGRTGRSGMHTEGSVIFADPIIYDRRRTRRSRWRWEQAKELLDPSNSEPCASTLLQLFEPFSSDDNKYFFQRDILDYIKAYLDNPESIDLLLEEIVFSFNEQGFTMKGLVQQMEYKLKIVSSIESYLMTHGDELDYEQEAITELAKGTLAYYLGNEDEKMMIVELFKLLSRNILNKIPEESKRNAFGKTLYGVDTTLELEKWLQENIEAITKCSNLNELLFVFWPVFTKYAQNSLIRKCNKPGVLKEVAIGWIEGKPFKELYNLIREHDVRLISGKQLRHFSIDHLVELCENILAYDSTLILGAVVEIINFTETEEVDSIIDNIQLLQKRMKYGLLTQKEIIIYELGFADRIVCNDISTVISDGLFHKNAVISELKQMEENIREILKSYPSYFNVVFKNLLTSNLL